MSLNEIESKAYARLLVEQTRQGDPANRILLLEALPAVNHEHDLRPEELLPLLDDDYFPLAHTAAFALGKLFFPDELGDAFYNVIARLARSAAEDLRPQTRMDAAAYLAAVSWRADSEPPAKLVAVLQSAAQTLAPALSDENEAVALSVASALSTLCGFGDPPDDVLAHLLQALNRSEKFHSAVFGALAHYKQAALPALSTARQYYSSTEYIARGALHLVKAVGTAAGAEAEHLFGALEKIDAHTHEAYLIRIALVELKPNNPELILGAFRKLQRKRKVNDYHIWAKLLALCGRAASAESASVIAGLLERDCRAKDLEEAVTAVVSIDARPQAETLGDVLKLVVALDRKAQEQVNQHRSESDELGKNIETLVRTAARALSSLSSEYVVDAIEKILSMPLSRTATILALDNLSFELTPPEKRLARAISFVSNASYSRKKAAFLRLGAYPEAAGSFVHVFEAALAVEYPDSVMAVEALQVLLPQVSSPTVRDAFAALLRPRLNHQYAGDIAKQLYMALHGTPTAAIEVKAAVTA